MITEREIRLLRIVRQLSGWQVGTIARKVTYDPPARLSVNRLHKASSAESILAHCLKQRGWTRAYWAGELTGGQHLELLDGVRNYGRAWLRHEAEQFARVYLGLQLPATRAVGLGVGREPWSLGGAYRAADGGLGAHLGRFFRRAKNFVRELIVGGMMALTGPTPLTGEELEAADKEAQKQEQFFDQFYDEMQFWGGPSPARIPIPVEPGIPEPPKTPADLPPAPPVVPVKPSMSARQFVARVEKYANSSHHAAQQANRAAAIQQGVFKVERRVLGRPKTEHCHDCPPLAALGWQPIGTLPDIGETECAHLCLCHFEFADKDGGQPYFQGSKGPVPAPSGVHVEPDDGGVHMIAEPPGVTIQAPIAGPPK